MTVAALYIDRGGPYPKMHDVDCWDIERDAKLYDGPFPVVAHPPCGPWGRLRHLSRNQDPDCAIRAVEQVRAFGGVLEHPAGSRLWDALALPEPGTIFSDAWGGWSVELFQCDWGHVARKRTWLYMVGVDRLGPFPPRRRPTHWISGSRDRRWIETGERGVCPPGIKICSAQQRRRTPPAFASWLVSLARSVSAQRSVA